MKGSTSLGLLVLAVLATPVLAVWAQGAEEAQDPIWQKHLDKACNARRYGLRIAATKKVAQGGDAAVPAIRAFADEHGMNKLPSALVDEIANSKRHGDATTKLLTDWANDKEFYWRSAALLGLALRDVDDAVFEPFVDDPAWKMRTHARFGLARKGNTDVLKRPEPDPRAGVRLASLLIEQGQTPPLQPLFDALADERTFLEDPWGARLGMAANKALRRWLAADYPKELAGDPDRKDELIAAIAKAAETKSGQTIAMPSKRTDANHTIAGGFEILSCKFGDQFIQWTDDGTLLFDIDGGRTAKLDADAWQELMQDRTAIALDSSIGVVICDSMRIRLMTPNVHVKVAPESLPAEATAWLMRLSQKLEEADQKDLATELRRGLSQFVGR